MKKRLQGATAPLPLLLVPLLGFAAPSSVAAQSGHESVLAHVEANATGYGAVAQQIWDLAEVGYQETESSSLLQAQLANAGFQVEAGVAGMPTAFVASWGEGSPVIGILAEFDALPGITQGRSPERLPRPEMGAGHACGHHLFGTGSVAAGLAVKDWLASSGTSGTIRVYGTPAEEGGAGKVYMVRGGLFGDVDAVVHWHPGNSNSASPSSSLANKSAKFRFHGISAHAAGAPEQGRSALDGVEAMNNMVNMLREHVPQETRIHYVITSGGAAPNVVPDFAEVYYYVRNPDSERVRAIFDRVVLAAEGAAMGTGTRMEYEVIHGIYAMLSNEALQRRAQANLEKVGGVVYDEAEKEFAAMIQETLDQQTAAGERRRGAALHAAPGRRLDRRGRRELGRAHGGDQRRDVGAGHARPLMAGHRGGRNVDRREGDGRGRQDAGDDGGGPVHGRGAAGGREERVPGAGGTRLQLRVARGRPGSAAGLQEAGRGVLSRGVLPYPHSENPHT